MKKSPVRKQCLLLQPNVLKAKGEIDRIMHLFYVGYEEISKSGAQHATTSNRSTRKVNLDSKRPDVPHNSSESISDCHTLKDCRKMEHCECENQTTLFFLLSKLNYNQHARFLNTINFID